MITFAHACDLAGATLRSEGADGPVSWRTLDGGWRFWSAPAPGVIGGTHVAVAVTGRTVVIPAGAPDAVVERRLAG